MSMSFPSGYLQGGKLFWFYAGILETFVVQQHLFHAEKQLGKMFIFELKVFCLVSPYEADLSVISHALLVVIPFGDFVFLFRPDRSGPYNLSKIVNV